MAKVKFIIYALAGILSVASLLFQIPSPLLSSSTEISKKKKLISQHSFQLWLANKILKFV